MTISCKPVHRLELQKFLNFCAAHLPVKRDIEKKLTYFLFRTCWELGRNMGFGHFEKMAETHISSQHENLIWTKSLVLIDIES